MLDEATAGEGRVYHYIFRFKGAKKKDGKALQKRREVKECMQKRELTRFIVETRKLIGWRVVALLITNCAIILEEENR